MWVVEIEIKFHNMDTITENFKSIVFFILLVEIPRKLHFTFVIF